VVKPDELRGAHVLVAGAGISGRAAAVVLLRLGARVTVSDARPEALARLRDLLLGEPDSLLGCRDRFARGAEIEQRCSHLDRGLLAKVAASDVYLVLQCGLLLHAALTAKSIEDRERELHPPVIRRQQRCAVLSDGSVVAERRDRRESLGAHGARLLADRGELFVEASQVRTGSERLSDRGVLVRKRLVCRHGAERVAQR